MSDSLRDRIGRAESEKVIDVLLAEGAGYKYAKPRTRRQWAETADARRAELRVDGRG